MSDIVKLNVGGVRYETTLATLVKYEDSMLHKMFSDSTWLENAKRDEDGYIFFDASATGFELVLNYLRHGGDYIKTVDAASLGTFSALADYLQLTDLVHCIEERKRVLASFQPGTLFKLNASGIKHLAYWLEAHREKLWVKRMRHDGDERDAYYWESGRECGAIPVHEFEKPSFRCSVCDKESEFEVMRADLYNSTTVDESTGYWGQGEEGRQRKRKYFEKFTDFVESVIFAVVEPAGETCIIVRMVSDSGGPKFHACKLFMTPL